MRSNATDRGRSESKVRAYWDWDRGWGGAMLTRLWRHMRGLWPTWTLLPAAPFVAWTIYCFALGERRWEHLGFLVGVPLLAYTGPRSKKAYRALLPLGLVGLTYDLLRFV